MVAQKLDKDTEADRVNALAKVGLLVELGLPNEAASKVFLAGVRSRAAAVELSRFVTDSAASVSRIRNALLDPSIVDALSVSLSESTRAWLRLLSAEHGGPDLPHPQCGRFLLDAPAEVKTLHARQETLLDPIFYAPPTVVSNTLLAQLMKCLSISLQTTLGLLSHGMAMVGFNSLEIHDFSRFHHFCPTSSFKRTAANTGRKAGRTPRRGIRLRLCEAHAGVALLRAQDGFRRVRGHKELGALAAALGRASGADEERSDKAEELALPSAVERCELAIEIGFSYRMSISQPDEIRTI